MTPATRERMRTVLFMVGLTAVVMSIVTTIQLATAGLVGRNRTAFLKRAVLEAAGVPCPADTADMLAVFDRTVSPAPAAARSPAFYRVRDEAGGRTVALVFKRDGVGLWGRITAVVGLDPDVRTITGVAFVEQNETPGLGARIEEPWFRGQFRGKRAPFRLAPEGKAGGADEINAITGATITVQGVKAMLEKLLAESPDIVRQHSG